MQVRRILLIEDSTTAVAMLVWAVREVDARALVAVAPDWQAAAVLLPQAWDRVFVDLILPDIEAAALVSQLRSDSRVVWITALPRLAHDLGLPPDKVCKKPINSERLRACLLGAEDTQS